ncbi:hypothetical protein JL107_09640 [Nakamurella flavida]|uniref:DUF11 domain-containing protein n=1 Tax=Nakamurella flavida TaxID=363630 RepID=A0A938YFG6_9ACTN|nr:DUF11 domain-containing protein [Nakamurella flavida]MBM9476705.1 hypothetical protein [Nakamurella flavida]MDP9778857.1 putative repeat protein (TIGR01451 family) [Nakamurella flavida]
MPRRPVSGTLACLLVVLIVGGGSGLLIGPPVAAAAAAPPAAAAAAAAAPDVDLRVTVAGPASGVPGGAFTYRVVASNNSLPSADGAVITIALPEGATEVATSCAAAGGAVCPDTVDQDGGSASATVPTLPHLGEITVTVTGRFPATPVSSVTLSATVVPPAGLVDTDPASDSSSVSTALLTGADLSVDLTQASGEFSPGEPLRLTLGAVNDGPEAADGALLALFSYGEIPGSGGTPLTARTHIVSCTATGGAVCPDLADRESISAAVMAPIPTFPAGSRIVVVLTVEPQLDGLCTPPVSWSSAARITGPPGATDPDTDQRFLTATGFPPACAPADLSVTQVQAAGTFAPGEPFELTVTARNDGPEAADGALLSISGFGTSTRDIPAQQAAAVTIRSCTASGGAVCPELADTEFSALAVQTAVPSFPAGGSVVIVLTVDPVPSSGCGTITWHTTSRIAPPAGRSDPKPGDNERSTDAVGPDVPCPVADLTVSQSQASDSFAPGEPLRITLTVGNDGPEAADGAFLSVFSSGTTSDGTGRVLTGAVRFLSCTAAGGAVCPVTTDRAGSNPALQTALPTFPAGGRVVITMTVDPTTTGTCSRSIAWTTSAQVSAPDGVVDPAAGNGSTVGASGSAPCVDVSVNSALGRVAVRAGDPVRSTVVVAASGTGPARSVRFTDVLPVGFVYSGGSCVPATAVSTCGPLTWNPVTREVSSTIPVIGAADSVTFTLTGTAGPVPGTFATRASAVSGTGADAYVDINPGSDVSTVNLQISNTASRIGVTPVLTGLPAGGVSTDLPLSGEIICGTQGAVSWSATVPAGASTAGSAPVLFYDGEDCTVSVDAFQPPAGYVLVGPPQVATDGLRPLGPDSDVRILVTVAFAADESSTTPDPSTPDTSTPVTSTPGTTTPGTTTPAPSTTAPGPVFDPAGTNPADVVPWFTDRSGRGVPDSTASGRPYIAGAPLASTGVPVLSGVAAGAGLLLIGALLLVGVPLLRGRHRPRPGQRRAAIVADTTER